MQEYEAWYKLYLAWYERHTGKTPAGTVTPMDGDDPPPPPFPPHPNKV
jgi:hypothetical protein